MLCDPNLWLAATHEGLAVEWVSLVDHELIRQELRLPESIEAVGYMCLGYAQTVYALPELEVRGWAKRDPIAKHMLSERWNE